MTFDVDIGFVVVMLFAAMMVLGFVGYLFFSEGD